MHRLHRSTISKAKCSKIVNNICFWPIPAAIAPFASFPSAWDSKFAPVVRPPLPLSNLHVRGQVRNRYLVTGDIFSSSVFGCLGAHLPLVWGFRKPSSSQWRPFWMVWDLCLQWLCIALMDSLKRTASKFISKSVTTTIAGTPVPHPSTMVTGIESVHATRLHTGIC